MTIAVSVKLKQLRTFICKKIGGEIALTYNGSPSYPTTFEAKEVSRSSRDRFVDYCFLSFEMEIGLGLGTPGFQYFSRTRTVWTLLQNQRLDSEVYLIFMD